MRTKFMMQGTIQKFQRLAKLYSFEWLPFSKKVESFINTTFLVNTLIQEMSRLLKRPIQSKFSSQPAPATKAKTAPLLSQGSRSQSEIRPKI